MLKDPACLRLYLLSCRGGRNFLSLWPLSLKMLSNVRLQISLWCSATDGRFVSANACWCSVPGQMIHIARPLQKSECPLMTCVTIFFFVYCPRTKDSYNSENFAFNFLTTKQGTPNSERHCNSIIKHKLSKPPRVCFRQMARIELCRLPFSF